MDYLEEFVPPAARKAVASMCANRRLIRFCHNRESASLRMLWPGSAGAWPPWSQIEVSTTDLGRSATGGTQRSASTECCPEVCLARSEPWVFPRESLALLRAQSGPAKQV